MEEKKIKLEIYAISYSQAQTGAYALILGETEGKKRLPIIIGAFEAQSIAIAIEKMKSSRPLTHDLFVTFSQTFDITIKEIIIDKYAEGIFFSKLICVKNKEEYEIDSRTSDAIAIAVRFACPIYAYESIIEAAGVLIENEKPEKTTKREPISSKKETNEYKQYTSTELSKLLEDAVSDENYEKASEIRDEITKRKKKK